jgi:hypothetical protein
MRSAARCELSCLMEVSIGSGLRRGRFLSLGVKCRSSGLLLGVMVVCCMPIRFVGGWGVKFGCVSVF